MNIKIVFVLVLFGKFANAQEVRHLQKCLDFGKANILEVKLKNLEQRYYNLSDDQIEYQINDRMSFMRFLNLTIANVIPDSKTVWNFREQLINSNLIDVIFDLFLKELEALGLIVNEGKIIDASFIKVPKQSNSRTENEQIKNGETPDSFNENPNKKAQKDQEARWTKKNNVNQIFK